jgi:hypothetical protein
MEEWALQNSSQKKLYRDVMQETLRSLVAVCKANNIPYLSQSEKNVSCLSVLFPQCGIWKRNILVNIPGMVPLHHKYS